MKKMTIDEQIAKAQARVAELKAKRAKSSQKNRNGELIALGIIVENQFNIIDDGIRSWLKKAAESQTDERVKQRGLAAIARLEEKIDDTPKEERANSSLESNKPSTDSDRIILNVPYNEKDQAKEAGAIWDSKTKVWWIAKGADLTKLVKWLPNEEPS